MDWQIMLLYLAVRDRRMLRKMLPVWGGGIILWGCFSGAGLCPTDPVKGNLNASATQDILDKPVQQFGEALFCSGMTVPQCKVHEVIVEWVWCRRTWLACTDPWSRPHRPLGGTKTELMSQALSLNVSFWPHRCSSRWKGKLPTQSCGSPSQKTGNCKDGTNFISVSVDLGRAVNKCPVGVPVLCPYSACLCLNLGDLEQKQKVNLVKNKLQHRAQGRCRVVIELESLPTPSMWLSNLINAPTYQLNMETWKHGNDEAGGKVMWYLD